MNTLDAIFARKSVRSYTGEKTPADVFEKILKAAIYAPVGRAKYENVHITVIEDKELLQKIDANAAKVMGNPDMHPLYGAPQLVLVSAKGDGALGNVEFSNAAIIVHNMALAATELGVGCCHIWGAIRTMEGNDALVSRLKLPEGVVPCCALALGVTEEKYEHRDIQMDRIGISKI